MLRDAAGDPVGAVLHAAIAAVQNIFEIRALRFQVRFWSGSRTSNFGHKISKNSFPFVFRSMYADKRAGARFSLGSSCAKDMLPPIVFHHIHHALILLGILAS